VYRLIATRTKIKTSFGAKLIQFEGRKANWLSI